MYKTQDSKIKKFVYRHRIMGYMAPAMYCMSRDEAAKRSRLSAFPDVWELIQL